MAASAETAASAIPATVNETQKPQGQRGSLMSPGVVSSVCVVPCSLSVLRTRALALK